MTFAEYELNPQERDKLTNRLTLLNAAASVMRDKPCGSKLYMDCARQTRTCANIASRQRAASSARSRTALRGQGQGASESAATRNLSI